MLHCNVSVLRKKSGFYKDYLLLEDVYLKNPTSIVYESIILTLCPLKRGRFSKTCLKGIVKYPPRRSKQLTIMLLQLRLPFVFFCDPTSITMPIRYAQHPAIACSFSRYAGRHSVLRCGDFSLLGCFIT